MVQRFERPATAQDAAKLRAETGGLFVAGGTQVNIGGAPDIEALIALDALPLDFVREEQGAVRLGALLTLQELADRSELAELGLSLLCDAARDVGSRAIRNRATVGGNLAARLPYSDLIPPLVALGAAVELCAAAGTREVSLEDYLGTLDADALITSVLVRRPSADSRSARRRFARTSADLPLVNVALVVTVSDSAITAARLAIGGAATTVVRAPSAEKTLVGSKVSAGALAADFADAVREEIRPIADLRGGVEYKTHLAVELSRQALIECLRKEVA